MLDEASRSLDDVEVYTKAVSYKSKDGEALKYDQLNAACFDDSKAAMNDKPIDDEAIQSWVKYGRASTLKGPC